MSSDFTSTVSREAEPVELTGVDDSMVRHASSGEGCAKQLNVLLLVLGGVVLPIGVVRELTGLGIPG